MKNAVRIVWKDEGRDAEGRPVGPAHAENAAGELIHNYGRITWKRAKDVRPAELGVDFEEV